MANDWFEFKKFVVCQQGAAMKVGTDGVLLGAWTPIEKGVKRVLDIGTGTGLIALMIAQRLKPSVTEQRLGADPQRIVADRGGESVATNQTEHSADMSNIEIKGIEIDPLAANQARQNVQRSVWAQDITIINDDICRWSKLDGNGERFDLIVSNPPYFVNSLNSPVMERSMARHTDLLSFDNLIEAVVMLISPEGVFSVILPYGARESFVGKAVEAGLELVGETVVYAKQGAEPKRVLMAFMRSSCRHQAYAKDNLTIRESDDYSEQYKRLTREFYINF